MYQTSQEAEKKKKDKLKFKHTSGLYLGKIVLVAEIIPHIRLESILYQNNFKYTRVPFAFS